MKKTIEDPSPLLRKLERAPPTRELMAIRQNEIDVGFSGLFEVPTDDMLPAPLRDVVTWTMRPKKTFSTHKDPDRHKKETFLKKIQDEEFEPIIPSIGDQPGPPIIPEESELEPEKSTQGSWSTRGPDYSIEREGLKITKRTATMHAFLEKQFTADNVPELSFNKLFAGKAKHTVAVGFFELLNIRSKNCINLTQPKPYEDITITKTEHFSTLLT